MLFASKNEGQLISESIANSILRFYKNFAPQKLASVILESNLTNYDRDFALQLLESISSDKDGSESTPPRNDNGESSEHRDCTSPDTPSLLAASAISPKNTFARALLYLENKKIDQAVADFLSVHPHILVEFCVANPTLLFPQISGFDLDPVDSYMEWKHSMYESEGDDPCIPSLARLLLMCAPFSLLEIVCRLGGKLPLQLVLRILSPFHDFGKYLEIDASVYDSIWECFLEMILIVQSTAYLDSLQASFGFTLPVLVRDPWRMNDAVASFCRKLLTDQYMYACCLTSLTHVVQSSYRAQ